MAKNGIDISAWQADADLSVIPCDFVIIKATEGVSYFSPSFEKHYNQAISLGKMVGIYHFASSRQTGMAEADYFLSKIGDKYKNAFLVLDWEAEAVNSGVGYAKQFLDRVQLKTGGIPLIYMSSSVTRQFDWSSVAKTYPLWVAQYANMNPTGYQTNPWSDGLGYGAWGEAYIFQYSSCGRLNGYGGNLDINIMYRDPGVVNTSTPKNTNNNSTPTTATKTKKSIKQIAKEVIAGKWGNGDTRKNKLTKAGYDYTAVQRKVNALLGKQSQTYTVKSGDTLTSIAQKYNTTVGSIVKKNNLSNPDLIFAGQTLKV